MEDVPGVEYNDAKVREKDYQFTKGDVYMSDLTVDLNSLTEIEAKLKSSDRTLHRNGGGYKWMLSSLQALKNELATLNENHGPDDKLTADEVKKLDTLYRNLRSASRDYMADHVNPSTDMGQTRRNSAELMSNMRPLQLGAAKQPITKKLSRI